jgi:hypothetical protein
MLRTFYRWLLRLHPRRFRERFAEEMLWIFDEIRTTRERAFLLGDAFNSLAMQWIVRSGMWKFALAFFIALVQAVFILHPY